MSDYNVEGKSWITVAESFDVLFQMRTPRFILLVSRVVVRQTKISIAKMSGCANGFSCSSEEVQGRTVWFVSSGLL